MTRRSSIQIAKDAEERALRLQAEADRRRSVAGDGTCRLMYEAEKALLLLAGYCGQDGKLAYRDWISTLQAQREARWADLKARGLA